MPTRNQNFYDQNETRPWPLSDEATGRDDAGLLLPHRFLSDLRLTFPSTAGQRAMLSAITVTPTLVTAVFVATNSPVEPVSFTPLAAITLSKRSRADAHRQYALDALYPGAGGWIVFGPAATDRSATAERYNGRFSNPNQSILLPGVAWAYQPLPIPTTGILHHETALTGLVRLRSGTDIEIVRECREIPAFPRPVGQEPCNLSIDTLRDVIVIRLRQTTTLGATQQNLLDKYRGPCSNRPESQTCGDPAPIELLSSVSPDCCGNIDVRLRGCVQLGRIVEKALVNNEGTVIAVEDTCGVILGCNLGLEDVCVTADRLPDDDGTLPNEYDDLCVSISEVSITLPFEPPEESQNFEAPEESQSAAAVPELPICDDFSENNPNYVVAAGSFAYSPSATGDPSRILQTPSNSQLTNLVLLNFDFDVLYRRVSARTKMISISDLRHNAAVVANHHQTGPIANRYSYYLAEIDWDAAVNGYKLFRIAYFDGQRYSTEFAVAVPQLALDHVYDIRFSIFANLDNPNGAWLLAELFGVTNPSVQVTIGPLAKNNFGTTVGKFGMHAFRANTQFDTFCVENTIDTPSLGS